MCVCVRMFVCVCMCVYMCMLVSYFPKGPEVSLSNMSDILKGISPGQLRAKRNSQFPWQLN